MGADFVDYIAIWFMAFMTIILLMAFVIQPQIDDLRKQVGCLKFDSGWVCPDKNGDYVKDGIRLSVNVSDH